MIKKVKYSLSKFYFEFLNLIYNQKCLICNCGKDNVLLCKTCAKDVEYLSCFAHRIYKKIPIYSAGIYDGIIKKLIHKLKFQHKKIAAKVLAQILFNYFKKCDFKNEFIICYPQGFYLRNSKRGYNQVELIVKEFSKLSKIKYIDNLILKTKYTKPQYKAKNKQKNIKDSFKINEKYLEKINNKTLLIIDDITTSGATLNEIINMFFKKNINDIICLTVAKSKNS